MNRERAKELLPIIQEFAEGKTIQCRGMGLDWADVSISLTWEADEYRIKPEPREFWLDPADFEVWEGQENPPVPDAIKVREVLSDDD